MSLTLQHYLKYSAYTLASLCMIVISGVYAETKVNINEQRAKFNYQMFCQGCHHENGEGHKGVPHLQGFVGTFLKSQQGREYLVRVPGSANSALNDQQLAEVLNWMLINFAEDSLSNNWQPYNAEEVSVYRKEPLLKVVQYRKDLIKQILTAP